MMKKKKLTAEFWRRDAEIRRELERRIAAIDAKMREAEPEDEPPPLPPRLSE